jgi:serine O-acetyltransferase
MFENIREDWVTHERSFTRGGFWTLAVYRFGLWRDRITWRPLRLPFSLIYHVMRLTMQVVSGIVLPQRTKIGRRLRFDHFGGVVIHHQTVLGDDCIIRHGVTIGLQHANDMAVPRLGNRVDIGSGAAILGPITIGDDVLIGSNAVVITDVPSNSTAVGVPARVISRRAS